MNHAQKLYRLRDCTSDKVVFVGTAAECAEVLGIKERSFHVIRSQYASRGERPKSKGHYLEELGRTSASDMEAIIAWDTLTERLRREFGIPRYVPEKGVKDGK